MYRRFIHPREPLPTDHPSPPSSDSGESRLPLQYEDGPDYCTVKDAQGRDFALTTQPDLMKAMEKALSGEIADFMYGWRDARLVTAVEALRSIHGRLWRDGEPYDERIADLKSLALAALTAIAESVAADRKLAGWMGDISGNPYGPSDY